MEPKEIKVKTLNNLIDLINDDNIEVVGEAVVKWLKWVNYMCTELRKGNPELCEGQRNSELAKFYFLWIDDGKSDVLETKITTKHDKSR